MDLTRLARTGGPVLFWRGPNFDTLDLTGPVIANWVNKGVGLFGDYDLGPDFTLFVPLPGGLHWRELVAILSVLLAGGRVVLGAQGGAGGEQSAVPDGDFHALVPLGFESDPAIASAEEIFVFNPPALALSTPVDADFIDVNSAIRAYPDVTPRRLDGSGTLAVLGPAGTTEIPWTAEMPAGRPAGILVSHSTPHEDQWPDLLGHLLGGGETVLGTGVDEARIADLARELGEVRGRLGTWTK
ncbi:MULTISPECIES: hypothetical protein [unclassified Brevibacterium]|uniref:hypothetical protein n=1 Tax=unclassified Brevibacterium TaxID=2614124 RepID=UPI0010F77791|nr:MULTISPECIES: hypothetical protein [unclassified Brevibacterium]MCM1014079.1 hypothetical protein [Brevibacterium sp. XM4083]